MLELLFDTFHLNFGASHQGLILPVEKDVSLCSELWSQHRFLAR
jgi:hypothetical protein